MILALDFVHISQRHHCHSTFVAEPEKGFVKYLPICLEAARVSTASRILLLQSRFNKRSHGLGMYSALCSCHEGI